MIRDGEIELYNNELRKVVDKGHLAKLSDEEIENHDGPMSYISHHPVYKESKSTPIRIVTNTSLKNKTSGLSPNTCMGKPPNAVLSLLGVFMRWMTYTVALNLNLTKAYQSIQTPGPIEKHVRR